MKILYFDCYSGISGDMTLGALLDCGIDHDLFKEEISKLNLEGYSLEIGNAFKNNIKCTDVNVIINPLEEDEHIHEHEHKHEHEHTHEHEHEHTHEHIHRNLMDIYDIIDKSSLNNNVKDLSKRMFLKLAEAEAKIHGKSINEVHFHEVGAIDSIIDIVGVAICIDMLKIDKFICSPINTGGGFIKCQHGIIPVPGPAVMEILKGIEIYSNGVNSELVTPTGAVIISTLCSESGPIPSMVLDKTGYGSGKKELDIPNMLRVIIGEEKKKSIYM